MTIHSHSLTVENLLNQLTLEEQVALLSGADFWRTVAIPRLNIPQFKVTDGPAGARGGGALVGGKKTAAFPVGIALGSSWNTELLQEIGRHLAREAQEKGAGALLAPTVNLFRSALNGRNFESYSEDPLLTGKLGAAYIQGLQECGVAATVKHYAGNESEYQRMTISSEIPERALRELYLVPFELAVKEGGAWAVMSAYNKVNGTYASENKRLLTDILRGEWGFDGLVMSDWFGSHSAGKSVRAGLDLEMPGPARARTALLGEAQQDEATRQAVRNAARNVLRLLERTRTFESPKNVQDEAEREEEALDTRALIRHAGAEGIVLLKNTGLLPLKRGIKVAVIGPNAAAAQVMGGGSAQMNAHRKVSPLQGLREALGDANVTYALGCDNDRFLPVVPGPVHIEYRAEGKQDVLASEDRLEGEVMWFGPPPQGVPAQFNASLTTAVTVTEAGRHDFGLASAGLSRLSLDGEVLIDNWETFEPGDTYFGVGSNEKRARRELEVGTYTLTVEFTPHLLPEALLAISAVRLGFRKPLPENSLTEAARVAAEADVVVVCVGTNGDWETEGVDRWGLDLPGQQDNLVLAVTAANPNTVVLLQTGGPVVMPWLDQVKAVLQAWFLGQETGYAITDVLLGLVDPGGRLPQTFPAKLEDDPTHPETPDVQYPGQDGKVEYREGLFTGYRHVDRANLKPLFPFGFGLSYTQFEVGSIQLSEDVIGPGTSATVTLMVRNVGTRTGQAVVQLYVRDVERTLDRPEKELKAFEKITLEPSESRRISMVLDPRAFAYFDDVRQAWVADAGEFEVLVGLSSADLPLRASVRLTEEWLSPIK